MMRRVTISFCLLYLSCCSEAVEQVNLARYKSYTISPKPNYSHCTDVLDKVQLTDGKKRGSYWADKSTVGWRVRSLVPEITVDLGKIAEINEIRVYTRGGGVVGVWRPDFVIVLVSKAGRSFKCAGVAYGRDNGKKTKFNKRGVAHTLVAENLETEGRFVKLLLQPSCVYVFLDEVEVIGSFRSHGVRHTLTRDLPSFSSRGKLFDVVESQVQLRDNLNKTVEFVPEQKQKLGSVWDALYKELQVLLGRLSATDRLLSIEELAGFDKELGLIRSKIYREMYKRPYVCTFANPMEQLLESSLVSVGEPVSRISVSVWKRESESVAFNIINSSAKSMTIFVDASPLRSSNGRTFSVNKVLAIRRGVFVKARRIGSIADALISQGRKPFELKPGEVTQIWLAVDSGELDTGSYKASLGVFVSLPDGDDLQSTLIPIDIEVEPIDFPKDPAFNAFTWAYPRLSAITNKSLSETAKDLSSHYTNVFVVHYKNLPFPTKVSRTGTITAIVPYEKTDELLRINNDAKTYLFYYGFRSERKDSGRFGRWMSDYWKKAFSSWLVDWVEHLKRNGVGYDRFAMYPFDESLCDEFYELAKFIKEVDPKIRIFANSLGKGPQDFMRFRDLVNIWCPRENQCVAHPAWLARIKSFGKEVWIYDAEGPGKANEPYGYYRLLPWKAFKYGLTGGGFWAYLDYYDDSRWDDTALAIGHYAVVYGAAENPAVDVVDENIIPSRRWEAWREGIEDYVYLWQLQSAAKKMRTTKAADAERLQRFIKNQVDKVLAVPDDRKVVYQVRQDISQMLIQLKDGNFD